MSPTLAMEASTQQSFRTERSVPPVPDSIAATGLGATFVADLLLKVLYTHGARTGGQLAELVCLPFSLLDEILPVFQRQRLLEVKASDGHGRRNYVFELTSEGRTRAREHLSANAYVGPAPVPARSYRWWVAAQSVRNDPIPRDRIRAGFSHLVLDEDLIDRLGPGINSGKSIFLYGHPGNGKTEIAFALAEIVGSPIYVPHAVEIGGQVIRIYDPQIHRAVDEAEGVGKPMVSDLLRAAPEHDPRFVRVRRPVVIVGGELTLEELEPQESGRAGVYSAPPQLKANGGVFVIDDFGRQRVRPWDLLNRWMIPLDRGVDYLALSTGDKLEVPFDCLVFFATNLNPADIVEEAFLRRVRYKIFMPSPTRTQFAEIFRRQCRKRGIAYADHAVDLIYKEFYGRMGVEPRSCHPGDIVSDLCDHARYLGEEPTLSDRLLLDACLSYFVKTPKLTAEGDTPLEAQHE